MKERRKDNAHTSNRGPADRARAHRHGQGAGGAATSSPTSPRSLRGALALLVDREAIERENKRLVSRLKFAGLRQNAVVEDVDMKAPRGLDKALFAQARCRRLDRSASEPDHHRPDRRRQKLDRLCARRTRPAETIAPCSIIACQGCSMLWRWHAATAGMHGCSRPRARRAADPRRLGPRQPDARSGPRPAGDHRRSAWSRHRPS